MTRVHVLATGGTISYVGRDRLDTVSYAEHGSQLPVAQLLDRIPEVRSIAKIESEQLYEEDYVVLAIGPREWPAIAQRCNALFDADRDLAGIVITHGSAVVEETAYFLNLTVKHERPVVLTAAQRPTTAMSTDGDVNLMDAVRVAASDSSRGKGVLVVVNNEIHAAREATKSNTFRLETFHPKELGFLGYADSDGSVVFYRQPIRKHTLEAEFEVASLTDLPWVEVIFVHGGSDARMVNALADVGLSGIVVATMGAGTIPPTMRSAIADIARKGTAVALSSRAGNGRVIQTDGMRHDKLIAADNLTPQKARVLLQLGLTQTSDPDDLQRMFNRY